MKKLFNLNHSIRIGVCILMGLVMIHERAMAEDGSSKGVSIKVHPIPSYPSGDEVEVKYTITNGTKSDLKMSSTGGGFDFKIVVEGPDGKRVRPYSYNPVPSSGKFLIHVMKPGESMDQFLYLYNYFPFHEVGVYRCILTRRVYGEGDRPANFKRILKGERIDVTAEPFEFRVESPSKETLWDTAHSVTGAIPGDELDGISGKIWYERPKPPVSSWESLKARKVAGFPVWLVGGGIVAAVLLVWLVIKIRK